MNGSTCPVRVHWLYGGEQHHTCLSSISTEALKGLLEFLNIFSPRTEQTKQICSQTNICQFTWHLLNWTEARQPSLLCTDCQKHHSKVWSFIFSFMLTCNQCSSYLKSSFFQSYFLLLLWTNSCAHIVGQCFFLVIGHLTKMWPILIALQSHSVACAVKTALAVWRMRTGVNMPHFYLLQCWFGLVCCCIYPRTTGTETPHRIKTSRSGLGCCLAGGWWDSVQQQCVTPCLAIPRWCS